MTTGLIDVWVFMAPRARFPGGVFSNIDLAEQWISEHQLTGTLTRYRLDMGAFEWALREGAFKPNPNKEVTAAFIGGFSSASMEHHHYEQGARAV
jgi:hypothetical protein